MRWFGREIVRQGSNGVWKPIDLLGGWGLVVVALAVVHFLLHLSLVWALVALLAGLSLFLLVGSYRVWNRTDEARLTALGERNRARNQAAGVIPAGSYTTIQGNYIEAPEFGPAINIGGALNYAQRPSGDQRVINPANGKEVLRLTDLLPFGASRLDNQRFVNKEIIGPAVVTGRILLERTMVNFPNGDGNSVLLDLSEPKLGLILLDGCVFEDCVLTNILFANADDLKRQLTEAGFLPPAPEPEDGDSDNSQLDS